MSGRGTPTAVEVHTRQAADFARAYAAYEGDPYHSCFAYSRMRLSQALRQQLPTSGRGLRALDVGCGTGYYLGDLVTRGFDTAGVDGSPAMLAEARRMNPSADLRQADVASLPFDDRSFDLVLCIEVLRYLRQPEACIAEIARVLRPGGRCLATAAPLFSINGYPVVNRLALILPAHNLVRLRQYFTTPAQLGRHFEHAGFVSPEIHGVYTGPINWVEHLAPRRIRGFLRRWEQVDKKLADAPGLRGLSNMLLIRAIKAV